MSFDHIDRKFAPKGVWGTPIVKSVETDRPSHCPNCFTRHGPDWISLLCAACAEQKP